MLSKQNLSIQVLNGTSNLFSMIWKQASKHLFFSYLIEMLLFTRLTIKEETSNIIELLLSKLVFCWIGFGSAFLKALNQHDRSLPSWSAIRQLGWIFLKVCVTAERALQTVSSWYPPSCNVMAMTSMRWICWCFEN